MAGPLPVSNLRSGSLKVVVFPPVSSFLRSFLTVVWFGLAAVLIAGLLLWVASLLRPVKPTREKQLTYESGVDPVGEGWSQSQVRYYIFALLFVIFDVEAVFIFPWATQLSRQRSRRATRWQGGHLRQCSHPLAVHRPRSRADHRSGQPGCGR